MKEIELIPNASSLIEATRSIGYTTESAISDIIDNSITANSRNIWVNFNADISTPYVAIIDDGIGMDIEQLKQAMMYGSNDPVFKRDKSDLGRFGLGLKTASMSQCRQLIVISKTSKSSLSGLMWDLDYLKNKQKWTVLKLEEEDIERNFQLCNMRIEHNGTIVIWKNLDRLLENESGLASEVLSKKMYDTNNHIGLVFHRFIDKSSYDKVNFYMNNQKIKSIDPFMSNKANKTMDPEKFSIKYIENNRTYEDFVTLTPYTLPHPSKYTQEDKEMIHVFQELKLVQGFYVYRGDRLIIWGTWFRLLRNDEIYKLARIKVDIPNTLDFSWSLDIKKSSAAPPHELRQAFRKIVENISIKSAEKYKYRKKIEEGGLKEKVWEKLEGNNGYEYHINRQHQIVKEVYSLLKNEDKFKFDILLRNIETKIPLNSIFVDFSSDKYNLENSLENDEIYKFAFDYLSSYSNIHDLDLLYQRLITIDIFFEKKEIVDKAKEALKHAI